MKTIVLSDIFGRTEALERFTAEISEDALILDPYDSEFMNFKNEEAAYAYFSENVGLGSYTDKLKRVLLEQQDEVLLIGFSVGASAIWNVSDDESITAVKKAICYYGSQIRSNVVCNPRFPIELVFPSMERHFSVGGLIQQLSGNQNVSIRQASYLHGFMNELSVNYDAHGYGEEIMYLNSTQRRD
ncbi:hypothetical protein B6N13_04530 [Marinomonas sp. UCMA 3892]|uniref:hypothetical protein n=1 Tax=unclassified Marinomonas TaxID=196814 RepID=UPI00146EA224|nr:hypothetical protein [Marinomonas sp. UCMA 3892]NLU97365.1 hypothetical protein [Marinomonas sp. UCMA 3892]